MAVALLGRKRSAWEEETALAWTEDARGAKRTKRCRRSREKLIRLKEDFPDMDETVRSTTNERHGWKETIVPKEKNEREKCSGKEPRRKRNPRCTRDLSTIADGHTRATKRNRR